MSDSYKIVVDNRERKVFDSLKAHCTYDYEIKTITVGDYAVMCNGNIIYIIERKSWKDLASSIKDGRIDNHKKLIDLRFNTSCDIILLIEGPAFPNVNNKIGNIHAKGLISHIDHMVIRDKFIPIYTRNKEHSIKRICSLIDSHKTIKWNKYAIEVVPNNRYSNMLYYYSKLLKSALISYVEYLKSGIFGGEDMLNVSYKKDDNHVQLKMLQCIPKISFNMASSIIEKYTVMELLTSDCILENMKHPSGSRYGDKVDKSISKIRNLIKLSVKDSNKYPNYKTITRDIRVQMLAQIPGISEKTALTILSDIPFIDLFNKDLSSFEITPTRKLGKKKASDIMTILSMSSQN